MNFRIILFIIFIITLFSPGCEQTIDGFDLPYEELIVVRGILEAGKPVKYISISKTIPPLEEYSIRGTEIRDADAFISCDGQKYPLKYVDSSYYNAENLIAVSGKQYELTVNWNGKTVYSKTTVPFPIIIDTVYIKTAPYSWGHNKYTGFRYSVEIEFIPYKNFVYLAAFTTYHNYGTEKYAYNSINTNVDKPEDVQPNGKIHSSVSYYISYTNDAKIDPFEAFVESYDKPFYEYFLTRNNMSMDAGSFLTKGGINVSWNVFGDGIGMFIGKATSARKPN
jgi:hypothetical protein